MFLPGRSRAVFLAVVVLTVPLAGCMSQSNSASVSSDGRSFDATSVNNGPGSFEYSGAMGRQSKEVSYDWVNPAPRAQVDWAGAVGQGEFTLTITDPNQGGVVYEHTFTAARAEARSETTELGAPGSWDLSIQLVNFTGSMELSITSG